MKIYILLITFVALFTFASFAYAEPYSLLQPLPGIKSVNSFGEYVSNLIPFIIMLAAVLAVVQIVIGGMEWALSESITAKGEGKDRITQALLGLLLALCSWLILNAINPDLLTLKDPVLNLNLQSSGSSPTSTTAPKKPPTGQKYSCATATNQCVPDPNGSYYTSDCGGCKTTPRPPGSVQLITCRNNTLVGSATYGDGVKTESELMTQCQADASKTPAAAGVSKCYPSASVPQPPCGTASTPTPKTSPTSNQKCCITPNGGTETCGPPIPNCSTSCVAPPNSTKRCN